MNNPRNPVDSYLWILPGLWIASRCVQFKAVDGASKPVDGLHTDQNTRRGLGRLLAGTTNLAKACSSHAAGAVVRTSVLPGRAGDQCSLPSSYGHKTLLSQLGDSALCCPKRDRVATS